MIEQFEYIQIRGISPDTPAHALGLTVRQSGHGVDGIIDKPLHPGTSHTKDEAEAKEMACRYHRQIRGGIRESRKRGKS